MVWDFFMFILILTHFFALLLSLYFEWSKFDREEYWDYFFEWPLILYTVLGTLCLLIDFVLQFHIIKIIRGTIFIDRNDITSAYISGQFIFDIIPLFMILLTSVWKAARYFSPIHFLFFLKVASIVNINNRIMNNL